MAAVAQIRVERLGRMELRRTAERLGLFALLAGGSCTAGEIEQALGWPKERCRRWMAELEAAGLVERYEEFYWSRN